MNPKYKQTIVLFAEVIIPDLQNNTSMEYAFIKNFKQIINGLEPESAGKIKLLVKVIDKLSVVYNFKTFEKLTYKQRTRYIDRLFNFPMGIVVGGLTGLRSIVMISYYGIDDVWKSIHYDGPINAHIK
ncbi:MAG: hypothetical protein J7K34_10825 [Flavobacteriaceae bacterium]|nr:hypothetical protein [Flavobacteriaceae bacterium]